MNFADTCCCDSRWKPFRLFAPPVDERLKEENRKYILTDETKEIGSHILHRIQAIRNFCYVEKGTLGGWIESERNLSHNGLCWVSNEACVYGNAKVGENASIFSEAQISENACVSGEARVIGKARVRGSAWVYGNAYIGDEAEIFGQGRAADLACVTDSTKIYDRALVIGTAKIFGTARICGITLISGAASIYKGTIDSTDEYFVAGPIGSRNDYTTFFLADGHIFVKCGCFSGTIKEFEQAVIKRHGIRRHANDYLDLINLAKKKFKRHRKE